MAHVEKRGAGRWRARYRGPDGRERSKTFDRKADAERWLAQVVTDKARGQWVDPAAGRITLEEWFDQWMSTVTLRGSTRDLYGYLARRLIMPSLGRAELARITATDVRRWLAAQRSTKLSPNTVAKAYRLLAHVMNVAVADGLIGRSPCTVEGAGTERSPEMKHATPAQVLDLAAAMAPRYQAIVLTAGFAGLRWGELAGLRRNRLDLLHRTVTVSEQVNEVNGHLTFGPPKTDAGVRTVQLPTFLAAELEQHVAQWSEPGPDGLVFPAPEGGPMRRSNFRRRAWVPARRAAGLEGLRFHDLRHSAGTMAAGVPGTSTKQLMARLGQASPRAALIYQHATAERDAAIADALDALAASSRPEPIAEVFDIGSAGG